MCGYPTRCLLSTTRHLPWEGSFHPFSSIDHPRMPLSLPDLRYVDETPAAYAVRMKTLEREVQALLNAAQQDRKALLDRGRVDTVFQVGDQVMLRTAELLDAAEIGKLRPRWEGPFRRVTAGRWQVRTHIRWRCPNAFAVALQ